MSCISPIKVKSVSVAGVKRAYVPCGQCVECNEKKKYSWQFRLRAEWLGLIRRPEEWHCAFCTLTYGTPKGGYRHDMRPRMPRCCYQDPKDYDLKNPFYCFNKRHCRQLLDNFKVWLHTNYGITKELRFRYLLASEYGDVTHRPHYHLLVFYPLVNGLTDEAVYKFLKNFWQKRHGMFFPQKFNGGDVNKKGMHDKPFLVENKEGRIEKTLAYVSKYICKDLEFTGCAERRNLKKTKIFKNYDCFHLQSKSLGACFLENLNRQEIYDVYFKGYSFVGDEKKRPLPVYLANKIVYDNYYIFERQSDGTFKRLVRRKASEFFHKNYKQIFERKAQFNYQAWKELKNRIDSGVERIGADLTKTMQRCYEMATESIDLRFLSRWCVACYGRPFRFMSRSPLDKLYLSRYDNQVLGFLWDNYEIEEESWLHNLSDRCNMLQALISIIGCEREEMPETERILIKLMVEDLRDL